VTLEQVESRGDANVPDPVLPFINTGNDFCFLLAFEAVLYSMHLSILPSAMKQREYLYIAWIFTVETFPKVYEIGLQVRILTWVDRRSSISLIIKNLHTTSQAQ
jgi:hypothetical protein